MQENARDTYAWKIFLNIVVIIAEKCFFFSGLGLWIRSLSVSKEAQVAIYGMY